MLGWYILVMNLIYPISTCRQMTAAAFDDFGEDPAEGEDSLWKTRMVFLARERPWTYLRCFERVVQAELHSQLELATVVRRWLGLKR